MADLFDAVTTIAVAAAALYTFVQVRRARRPAQHARSNYIERMLELPDAKLVAKRGPVVSFRAEPDVTLVVDAGAHQTLGGLEAGNTAVWAITVRGLFSSGPGFSLGSASPDKMGVYGADRFGPDPNPTRPLPVKSPDPSRAQTILNDAHVARALLRLRRNSFVRSIALEHDGDFVVRTVRSPEPLSFTVASARAKHALELALAVQACLVALGEKGEGLALESHTPVDDDESAALEGAPIAIPALRKGRH